MCNDVLAAGRPAIPVSRCPRNLPPPALDQWSWQLHGLCRDHPAEVFFPDEIRGRRLVRREETAKGICRECPVLDRCRQHAMTAPEPYGIWGAMTARERAAVLARTATSAPVDV